MEVFAAVSITEFTGNRRNCSCNLMDVKMKRLEYCPKDSFGGVIEKWNFDSNNLIFHYSKRYD